MSSTHVNREAVERRLERLQDEHGETYVHEEREEVPPDTFEELREVTTAGYTGGAYVWVVREREQAPPLTESMPQDIENRDRVLMILNRADERWGLPGGGREDGETYEEAAVREVREETGVECDLTDLFLCRRHVTASAGDHDELLHTLFVFFDAQYVDGPLEIQPGELNGAAWFADPPARLLPENEFRAADFWPDFEADDPFADPFW